MFKTEKYRDKFLEKYKKSVIGDFGCGNNKMLKTAVGVDCVKTPPADIVYDFNEAPYPFEDNYFDAVLMNHSIEHIKDIDLLMSEIHRILKPGGEIFIATPHFTESDSWGDLKHEHHFSIRSLEEFCLKEKNMFKFSLAYITLKGIWKKIGIEAYINKKQLPHRINKKARRWEERYCYKIRGGEMFFILKKI